MLHLVPQLAQLFIYELNPSGSSKYVESISILKEEGLYQLQLVDNLIALHSLDDKVTYLYDLKLIDFTEPVGKGNLLVDTIHKQNYSYHSDIPPRTKTFDSKEYFNIEHKFNYPEEEDEPINVIFDIEDGENNINKQGGTLDNVFDSNEVVFATRQIVSESVNVYSDSNVIYVEPMFIIDTKKFHCLTLKLNLHRMTEFSRNLPRTATVLLNRANA